jgi:hypothetical protein
MATFTVSDSRLPQPEGPGPRICIPQEEGGPVIPPGTGFPVRRLLWLAGLGEGVRTSLQTGLTPFGCLLLLYSVWVSKEMFVDHSYPRKRVPQRVGFQESISVETCLSHVTMLRE